MGPQARATIGFGTALLVLSLYADSLIEWVLIPAALAVGLTIGLLIMRRAASKNSREVERRLASGAAWSSSATLPRSGEVLATLNTWKPLSGWSSRPHGYLSVESEVLIWEPSESTHAQGFDRTDWPLAGLSWAEPERHRDITGVGYWLISVTLPAGTLLPFAVQGSPPPPNLVSTTAPSM